MEFLILDFESHSNGLRRSKSIRNDTILHRDLVHLKQKVCLLKSVKMQNDGSISKTTHIHAYWWIEVSIFWKSFTTQPWNLFN